MDEKGGEKYGITPACAGKRPDFLWEQGIARDHPRVCGEKASEITEEDFNQGSPPRARGKDGQCLVIVHDVGITPACAGKRRPRHMAGTFGGDHPRVRGEK